MANRAPWTEDEMRRSLEEVKNGNPVLAVSKKYGIPRRTLRNHITTGNPNRKLGTRSLLNVDQENELCRRIFRLAEVGMPLTPNVLRRSVFTFVEENGLKHPFSPQNRLAGRKWMALFYKRHPEVARRKSQMLNPARAQKLNRHIVQEYFEKLKNVLIDLNLINQPQLIYNMDEKGCRLTLHHQQHVLSRKGAKRVHLIAAEHAESATVVACGNALGQCIPPMILFKGKRQKPEWIDPMPPGTSIKMTAKGSMTAVTFTSWLDHFAKFKSPGRCLLIFDGARSHLDANIVDVAEAHGVTLLCLPSNTTHELQPLDKSVFRAFEHYWDEEVLNYWTREPERKITRARFGHILSIVWPKAMSPANLMAGFRATGIYPYNKDVITDVAYAPSSLTERPLVEITSNVVNEQNFKSGSDSESDWSDSDTLPLSALRENLATISPALPSQQRCQQTPPQPSTSYKTQIIPEHVQNSSPEKHEMMDTTFTELLPTPEIKTSSKPRQKANVLFPFWKC